MSPLSSFIFSSSADTASRGQRALRLAGWTFVGLATLDVFINLFFAYPSDPKNANPSRLQTYFEYGRSTDGQLARMTRVDPSQTAPITLAGWYEPLVAVDQKAAGSQAPVVTFYGMSHAVRLAEAFGRTTTGYNVRTVGAPGATANWSYGAYLRDRGGGKSRVVVLAFMSANLSAITTMSPMTWNMGFPMPYTSDRFMMKHNELQAVHPPYVSFDQYVSTFYNPEKWASAREIFAKFDTMFSMLISEATVLDHSSLVRLVRRAYGQHLEREARAGVLDQSGLHPESEQIKVARAIVREFARKARADGMIPIIYLVNNLGYSDYLFWALKPSLEEDKVPYVSSHQVISPSDPKSYLPDSHFIDAADDQIARALVNVIESSK